METKRKNELKLEMSIVYSLFYIGLAIIEFVAVYLLFNDRAFSMLINPDTLRAVKYLLYSAIIIKLVATLINRYRLVALSVQKGEGDEN